MRAPEFMLYAVCRNFAVIYLGCEGIIFRPMYIENPRC